MGSLSNISISNWVSGGLFSKYLVENFLDIYLQRTLRGLCPGWGEGRSLMDEKLIDKKSSLTMNAKAEQTRSEAVSMNLF